MAIIICMASVEYSIRTLLLSQMNTQCMGMLAKGLSWRGLLRNFPDYSSVGNTSTFAAEFYANNSRYPDYLLASCTTAGIILERALSKVLLLQSGVLNRSQKVLILMDLDMSMTWALFAGDHGHFLGTQRSDECVFRSELLEQSLNCPALGSHCRRIQLSILILVLCSGKMFVR